MRKNKWWNAKLVDRLSGTYWQHASAAGVHDIVARACGARFSIKGSNQNILNMSSYSYLGLDEHPSILQAAGHHMHAAGVLNSSVSRIRLRLEVLDQAEEALSGLFDADVGTVSSCAAAAWAMLPLLASGLLTDGRTPVMVFDIHAHFCLNAMKAACADEAEVLTIAHNDMERLEELCRTHPLVAYVADSVYSTGGSVAPMAALLRLQERYGLLLFLDEAHGTSIVGERGKGFALDAMGGAINDRTIIVTSLNKGFGASGGAILFGPRDDGNVRRIAARNGGPFLWSQRINTAGLGAILGSTSVHLSDDLPRRQRALQSNIEYFDSSYPVALGVGTVVPIRLVPVGSETRAVEFSARLLAAGFYVEPDFFPIVSRGNAGLRVRIRANMTQSEINGFCAALKELA